MSLVRMQTHDPYFFNQRKDRSFHRRLRKALDDYSVFGERRETLLTFRGTFEAESGGRRRSAASIRPGTAGRRFSTIQQTGVLPVIDPTGPNLVSGEGLEAVETKSTHSEKKLELLHSIEEKEKPKVTKSGQQYKVSEAKFASTSILSNLSKFLYNISDEFSVSLPVELVDKFVQGYQQLTADAVLEKREWQTDCYSDLKPNNRPFLTSAPEEGQRAKLESSVHRIARQQEKSRTKHVRMSREAQFLCAVRHQSPNRPQTARSIISNFSVRSDVSRASSLEDGESRHEYDALPLELRPRILHYRRESQVPKMKTSGPKTRLEKFKTQRGGGATAKSESRKVEVGLYY